MQLAGFTCPECNVLFAIDGDLPEEGYVELLLRGTFACPLCGKAAVQATLGAGNFFDVVRLGPRALWAYLNGLGLPKDVADWRTVKGLLMSHKVTDVVFDCGAPISPGRCIVERILLDNGKTLHFAPSGAGAMIYMVTEEEDGRQSTELRDHKGAEGSKEHPTGREASPAADVAGHGPQGEHHDGARRGDGAGEGSEVPE